MKLFEVSVEEVITSEANIFVLAEDRTSAWSIAEAAGRSGSLDFGDKWCNDVETTATCCSEVVIDEKTKKKLDEEGVWNSQGTFCYEYEVLDDFEEHLQHIIDMKHEAWLKKYHLEFDFVKEDKCDCVEDHCMCKCKCKKQ